MSENIRVGDTVKTTYTDGTTVEGVVCQITSDGYYSSHWHYLGDNEETTEVVKRRATQVGDVFAGGDVFDVPNGTLVSLARGTVLVKNELGLDSSKRGVRYFDERTQVNGLVFTVVFISDPNEDQS